MNQILTSVLLTFALSSAASVQAAPAKPPTPQQLLNLRLHDGFTLTYQVTVLDVRTPALREKDKTDQQMGIKRAIAEGHMTPQQAGDEQKQALTMGLHRPDEHFQITLSARDGKLLYLSNRSARDQKNGTKSAIILEGDREYEANDPMNGMINNDAWKSAPIYGDENVDRLAFCPLPGAGMPGVDLVQSPVRAGTMVDGHTHFRGRVPLLNLVGADPVYRVGEIDTVSVGGHLRVVSLLVGAPAVPLEAWKMTAFRLFQDHWIAAQMQMTEYEAALLFDEEPLLTDLPTSVSTYKLTEAEPTAREASAFEVGTYLIKGAGVFDDSTGRSHIFNYDPLGGTLKEQAEAVRKKELQKDLKTP